MNKKELTKEYKNIQQTLNKKVDNIMNELSNKTNDTIIFYEDVDIQKEFTPAIKSIKGYQNWEAFNVDEYGISFIDTNCKKFKEYNKTKKVSFELYYGKCKKHTLWVNISKYENIDGELLL